MGKRGGKISPATEFKPGVSGNPNGRPRKYVSLLKDIGYKRSEINDTIQSMMAMNLAELKVIWDNPNATILEKTIANAMKKSLEKGSLYSLETLLSRVYGQPKQEVATDITFSQINANFGHTLQSTPKPTDNT